MEPSVGIDLTGWGAVFLGVAAIITSLSAFYGQWKMSRKIRDIDHAVNGKKVGAKPMVDQVDDLHSDRPPPPELPPEWGDAAIRDLLKWIAADLHEQRKQK